MEKKSTKKLNKDPESGVSTPPSPQQDQELSDEEVKEIGRQRQFLSRAKRELGRDVDARRRYDYEWMVREMFRRGYHFSRYQPTTQTIILASRQSAKIPINIVAAQMRAIRNQVTSFRPKWEVLPRYSTKFSQTQARYSGRFLDYFFDRNKLKIKIKETVTQGLTFSVGGPWEIYYDKDKQEIKIYLLDPFDFYIDRYSQDGDLSDAQRVVKAVRQPLGDVRANKDFNPMAVKEIVGSDARLAVSEYKQFIIQSVKQLDQGGVDDSENIILYEGYFRQRDDNGKPYILKMVWTDQNITPLVYEKLDDDDFPFVVYRADINPKDIYGESWMKHVMPINRVIDMLESSVYDYNHRIAKGRIVVDRDAGVRSISNVHGEIISKNKGSVIQALDLPPLPIAVADQISRMRMYIEDVGAVHEASLGRVPAGVKSGIGVAELKQSDATGQDDLVDNLEDFLSLVGTKVLKAVSKNYSNYHFVHTMGVREGQEGYFAVVGEGSSKKGSKDSKHEGQVKIGPDWIDLAVIGEDNNIRVTVGSWLGYTKEMMQEKVLKYAQLGLIDQKTALRLLEFGDVDEIVQQTRIESLLQKQLDPKTGQQPGGQVDQYALAMTENEMMVNEGKPVKPDPHDDHIVHIALHQEALGQGEDEIVGHHIALHQMYAGLPVDEQFSGEEEQAPQQQGGQQPPQGMDQQAAMQALQMAGGQGVGNAPTVTPGGQMGPATMAPTGSPGPNASQGPIPGQQ